MENKQPEIRFPGFTDDWEQRKLGEVVQILMGQSPNSENYTDNPNDYILVQGNADMKDGHVVPRVWTKQVTKQAEKGDLILSVRAPVGDIGKTDYDVVLGRGVAAVKGNEFIFQQLGKMKLTGYWARYSTGSTFDSINSNDIKDAGIMVPVENEQTKIGLFFKQLDNTITLHQQELATLKQTKQGFLQKMFPKEGAKVPEVRFPGFTNDWEQRKLSEAIKLIGGNAFSSTSSSKSGIPWLKIANVDKNGIVWSTESFLPADYWEKYNSYQLVPGDYVMALTRPILNHTLKIGKVDKFALLNQRVAKLEFTLDKEFTFQLLQRRSIVDKIENELAGTDPPNLGSKNLTNIDVKSPKSITEQKKIGAFFQKIDNTITLHQRELELLQATKKAFLQKLFV